MNAPNDKTSQSGTPSCCQWPGLEHPLYRNYHDTEWGVPKNKDVELFEKLILEGFQAGLSWFTILKKRTDFRNAFAGFDPARMAAFNKRDIRRLMSDKQIVRNRLKIEAAIINARSYLALREHETLAGFLWSFLEKGPIINTWTRHEELPAQTPLSHQLSKALKKEGFRFIGPTTVYAYMQSVGMVNDHLLGCHRHKVCKKLQRTYQPENVS